MALETAASIYKLLDNCAIPIERQIPGYLETVSESGEFISNSTNTINIRLLKDRSDSNIKYYVEKTLKIDPGNCDKPIPDINEIYFYDGLRSHIDNIENVVCSNASALRLSSDNNTVTLRLEYLKDTKISTSFSEKQNAMVASGNISNYFKNETYWPEWMGRSTGLSNVVPQRSIDACKKLLSEIDMQDGCYLLDKFYSNRKTLCAMYKDAPKTIVHGDANHTNIRSINKSVKTVFLDWPRVCIGSCADDPARIMQPWMLFHSDAANSSDFEKCESSLFNLFCSRLNGYSPEQMQHIRNAFDIRSFSISVGLSTHVLSWLEASKNEKDYILQKARSRSWYQYILSKVENLLMSSEATELPDRLEKLKNRYHGKGASQYNKDRHSSLRWKLEQELTEKFLVTHKGKTVFDMPVGTGRFLPIYKEQNMTVIGMDRSSDMLSESLKQAEAIKLSDVTLVLGDATSFNSNVLKANVVVCTRFLNWLPSDIAKKVFIKLADACEEEMILTLSSIDTRKFRGDQKIRIEDRLKNMHVRKEGESKPPNGAHSFTEFLSWTEEGGMKLVSSDLMLEGKNHLRVEMHTLRKM